MLSPRYAGYAIAREIADLRRRLAAISAAASDPVARASVANEAAQRADADAQISALIQNLSQRLDQMEQSLGEDLQALQDDIQEARDDIQDLSGSVSTHTATLVNHGTRLSAIESQLGTLLGTIATLAAGQTALSSALEAQIQSIAMHETRLDTIEGVAPSGGFYTIVSSDLPNSGYTWYNQPIYEVALTPVLGPGNYAVYLFGALYAKQSGTTTVMQYGSSNHDGYYLQLALSQYKSTGEYFDLDASWNTADVQYSEPTVYVPPFNMSRAGGSASAPANEASGNVSTWARAFVADKRYGSPDFGGSTGVFSIARWTVSGEATVRLVVKPWVSGSTVSPYPRLSSDMVCMFFKLG